jgi:class 3 adenylate cyclase
MSIGSKQMPEKFRAVISEQVRIFEKPRTIEVRNSVPDTSEIPLADRSHWLRIPDVICVYVDMVKSTQLSATKQDKITAGAYQLFSDTAVRLFHEFEAPYIDVRGDGVFTLFNDDQPHRALAAAVTFKTFAAEEFVPRIEKATGLKLGSHIGIDQKTVLVKKLGLPRRGEETDRQNEVWAGKPVNMAAKLASLSKSGELWVSDRYFEGLTNDKALNSCGCPDGNRVSLWHEEDLTGDERFDFERAYRLTSKWCVTHGNEFCSEIFDAD